MPRYVTPPPSPSPAPSTSDGRSPSRSPSRSRSRSYSRSPSRSYSASPSPSRVDPNIDKPDADSVIKTSLFFLGSVAAATFCAHKFWPKGITYGDKEEWEEVKKMKRAEKNLQNERRAGRREDSGMAAPPGDRERRQRYSDRRDGRLAAAGAGAGAGAGYYLADRDRRERDRDSAYAYSDRGRSDYDYDHDDYRRAPPAAPMAPRSERSDRSSRSDAASGDIVERRVSRRETKYYPPAPTRYSMVEAAPLPAEFVRSSSVSRRDGAERGHPRRYYEEEEYVVREPVARPRRASVDAYQAGDGGFEDRRARRRYAREAEEYY